MSFMMAFREDGYKRILSIKVCFFLCYQILYNTYSGYNLTWFSMF